jgi:hypothetical protein
MATDSGWSTASTDHERVLVERDVLEGAAIRLVERHSDEAWVFLDRRRAETERDLRPAAYAALAAEDPGIGLVADLTPGWLAWRTSRGGEWARVPMPDAYRRVEHWGSDHSNTFVFVALDHDASWLERLWFRISWAFRRRVGRWPSAPRDADPWELPGPDTNDPSGTGDRVPRRPPDTPLAASVAMFEPAADAAD